MLSADEASDWDAFGGNEQEKLLWMLCDCASVFVVFVWRLIILPCAALSLTLFQKYTTFCLSPSVCFALPSLSALSLSQLWFKVKKTKKKHLQTVHTLLNCLQDTVFVCRAQCTHAVRGSSVKPPWRNQCFPRLQIRSHSVKTRSRFIRPLSTMKIKIICELYSATNV